MGFCRHIRLLGICIIVGGAVPCYSQSPYYSESVIKYDYSTHKTDKPIPFDRSFTLVVDKLSSKNVLTVDAFQVKFKDGVRNKVEHEFMNCDYSKVTRAIKDVSLKFNPYSDTLQIFFPPLKPNQEFDIQVVSKIPKEWRNILLNTNAQLKEGVAPEATAFDKFFDLTVDKLTDGTYTRITDAATYQSFYATSLAGHYANIADKDKYKLVDSLKESEVQAIDILTSKYVSDFKDADILFEITRNGLYKDVLLGNRDVSKVFQAVKDAATSLPYGHVRLGYLESNIKFFDSVLRRVNKVLAKGESNIRIARVSIDVDSVRTKLGNLRNALRENYETLDGYMKSVNNAIDADTRIYQGAFLAGGTVSSDLKTAGGNIFYLDAGITNILAPGLTGKAVYIPKLYWGISIYFRPIDKNTRRNRFPSKFDPPRNRGCIMENGKRKIGPDYDIVARKSIWQHLCLNVGVTIGPMKNPEFENLYNNTSLLVGPGYRFARAFKASAGLALINRSSQNPMISEKKIVGAKYVSLSVDIDFIQGLKDVTSILFK